MDILLSKVTQQAMNYAIRSGITITSGYAIQQCGRLLQTTRSKEKNELSRLQKRLDSKIRIISPAIDMIELISARGNTSLESAVALTKTIRCNIQDLGVRLSSAATEEEDHRRRAGNSQKRAELDMKLRQIIADIKDVLEQVEDAVPLINLAITTSGVSLSSNLPPSISPSRLLQASTFLTAGDSQYASANASEAQIGPSFTLSMYMLFLGHARQAIDEDGLRATTWKEVIHKMRLRLVRVPLDALNSSDTPNKDSKGTGESPISAHHEGIGQIRAARGDEFAYQLKIVEDLDDGRFHEELEDRDHGPDSYDNVALAGIREILPVHEISKIFYADTGKILNIGSEGEANNPILLLKRDTDAAPPRRMMQRDQSEPRWPEDQDTNNHSEKASDEESAVGAGAQIERGTSEIPENPIIREQWRLPPGLDPEWIAFEVFSDDPDSESDLDEPPDVPQPSRQSSRSQSERLESNLMNRLSRLHLGHSTNKHPSPQHVAADNGFVASRASTAPSSATGSVKTSLSLLEMLIRLTSLQQFQQCSHLAITDELIHFFLEESTTTGAADADARRQIRLDTRHKVGFDPYDESPVKRRGEQYQYKHAPESATALEEGWDDLRSPEIASDDLLSVPPSPLLLRSREHSSASREATLDQRTRLRSSTPSRSTPPLPGDRHKSSSLSTPTNGTVSRLDFLRDESNRSQGSAPDRSSPLARHSSRPPRSEHDDDTDEL
ncbi:MAG: hypothetical protein M1828_003975 [Chrysothrix sp. TS-e1954]|nr:MAG: hypothetical protein M1828_003975 [Chrysothrix sp. TS-e1954]